MSPSKAYRRRGAAFLELVGHSNYHGPDLIAADRGLRCLLACVNYAANNSFDFC